jgi:predicted DCC family thiol-disulfide oxidoreductase YuxK
MITTGPILIFDGVCILCSRLVKFVIRRDRSAKITFAQLQSPAGQSLLQRFDLRADDIDTVVYITGQKLHLKSSAILCLLKDMGGTWSLFYGFIIIPEFIRDYFYNLIARNRYRIFGKTESCMMPDPDIEKRFFS